MRTILPHRIALFAAAALSSVGTHAEQQDRSKPITTVNVQQTVNIQGTVTYRADPERPWRYARNYVKDRNQGQLAEAVVALVDPSLTESGRRQRPRMSVIDQKDFTFIPETVAIRVGDQVKFKNSDQAVHNVNSFALGNAFNVNISAGSEHVETFSSTGNLGRPATIGCIYHSAMRAWIYVFDHPYYQVTETDGHFLFDRVPPGSYTLEMVHPAGKLRWNKPLDIKAGDPLTIDIAVSPDNKVKSLRLHESKSQPPTQHDRENPRD